jgi:hypothetical protein
MHEMATRYLEDLRRELRRLPQDDRDDAVREIGSHIAEGEAAGRPVAAVLAQLGTAKELARAYIADAYLQESARPRGLAMMRMAAFVAGSGVLSLLVVPLLVTLAITFGITAIVSPAVGVGQVLGFIPDNEGVVYWGEPVPTAWDLPLTLAVCAFCAAIAWGSWRLLHAYSLRVLAGYQRALAALPL